VYTHNWYYTKGSFWSLKLKDKWDDTCGIDTWAVIFAVDRIFITKNIDVGSVAEVLMTSNRRVKKNLIWLCAVIILSNFMRAANFTILSNIFFLSTHKYQFFIPFP